MVVHSLYTRHEVTTLQIDLVGISSSIFIPLFLPEIAGTSETYTVGYGL